MKIRALTYLVSKKLPQTIKSAVVSAIIFFCVLINVKYYHLPDIRKKVSIF